MEEKNLDVSLSIDMGNLEGRFSNMFQVGTFGDESRLDCVYVDKATIENGSAIGKVVARVSMTTEALVELRNLLDRHVDGLFADEDASHAEQ